MSVATAIEGRVMSTVSGAVATVEFSHPKSNALPGALLRDLAATIAQTGARAEVRVIALRSGGEGAFCAGASFDELSAIRDESAGTEFFMGFALVILAMTRCPKPIVTRVQGKAVGGGVGLVAASDYAIARTASSVRLSEIGIGIGPFVVGPAIERKIGPGAFGAMALDGEWRDAQWAERQGLYAKVVDTAADLDAAVAARADQLAAANPAAVARIKQITWAGTEHWPALLEERAAMSGSLVLSEFTRKAIEQFRKSERR